MIIIWCALSTSLASILQGTKDITDPGPLSWSKYVWTSSPIALSTSNAGSVSDMTFAFNPYTQVSSGVFCVTFPTSFTVPSSCVSVVNLVSGVDTSVTIPSVTLPSSAGTYGLFAVYTRSSQAGRIIDMNLSFGSIYIATSISYQALTISSSNSYTQASAVISFGFTITQSLWKYDYFQVTVPSYYTLSSPLCQTTALSDSSSLLCYVNGNKLIMYGVNSDVIVSGSLSVSLQISGFVNPSVAYNSNQLVWTLTTRRYGAYYAIEGFSSTGPRINPSVMNIVSYKPYTSQTLVANKFTYMSLVFAIGLSVPSAGSIVFQFTNAVLNTVAWSSTASQSTNSGNMGFYSISPSISGTCTVSSTSVACSGFTSAVSTGTYTLTTYSILSSTYSSVVVATSDDSSHSIEQSNPYNVAYSSTAVLATTMSLKFATANTGSYSAYSGSSVIGYLAIKMPVIIPSGTTLNLILPISGSTNSELQIGSTSSFKANYLVSSSLINGYSSNLGSLQSVTPDPTVSSNSIKFKLNSDLTPSNYVFVYFTSDASSSLPGLNLPFVSSNTMTFYEVILSVTPYTTEYVYSAPFTIISNSLGAVSTLLCTDQSFAGIPLTVSFTPSFSFTTKASLYVSVEITSGYASDLGSGLSVGSSYPAYTSIIGVSFALGSSSVIMSGLSQLSTTSYQFTFPVGSLSGTLSGNVRAYYVVSSVQYEVMRSSISATGTSISSQFTSSSTIATYYNGIATTPAVQSTFDLQVTPLVASGSYSTGYLGVILPTGYNISSPSVSLTSNSGIKATILYSFTLAPPSFNFPSVYFQLSNSFSLSSSTPSFTIAGITAPSGSSGSDYVRFVQSSSTLGTSCTNVGMSSNPSITLSALPFKNTAFQPNVVASLGPTSLTANVTASLTTPVTISSASIIKFYLAWTLTSLSKISISGATGSVISYTGQVITVSSFNAILASSTINLLVTNVLPPGATGTTYHFSNIYVYTDSTAARTMISYTGGSTCTVSSAGSTGLSYFSSLSVVPNGSGLTATSVSLSFSLTNTLPATSTISINSPTGSWISSGDISLDCWFSLAYSSCVISSNVLVITISETYYSGVTLQLIVDGALALPSTAGATSGGFTVTTAFSGVTVDQDIKLAPSASQTLIVSAAPSSTISQASAISMYPSTIGETATYFFNFTTTSIISISNTVLLSFPKTFDPFLGSYIKYPSGDPTGFYINCSSSTVGFQNIVCKVSHWMVSINGISGTIVNGTLITFNLTGITNPSTVTPIGMYIVDSTGSLVAYNTGMSVSSVSSLPSNIIIRAITSSGLYLRSSAQYTIGIYLSAASAGSEIVVQFPIQYKLTRDNLNSVTCEGVGSSFDTGVTNCAVSDNIVLMPITSTYAGSSLFTINLNVTNPEWGYTGLSSLDGVSGYEYFTNKIEIGVRNSGIYSYKSYSQHGGYLGFNDNMLPIYINNYNPLTNTNYIVLKPGTQTYGVSIYYTGYFKAVQLTLTPSNSASNLATLEFTSSKKFILTKDINYIDLSVSTSIQSVNSLNYISWSIQESTLNGTSRYVVSYQTLVQVYASDSISLSLRFMTGGLEIIPLGWTSLPIEIFAPCPPENSLSITFSLLNSSITAPSFLPSSLTFSPGQQYKYYQIKFSTSSQYNVSLSAAIEYDYIMDGTNVLAYSQLATSNLYGTNVTSKYPSNVTSLTFTDITSNSMNVWVTLDSDSLIYWEFCHINVPYASYGELVSEIYPLTSENSTNINLKTQQANYLLGLRASQYSTETWQTFQKKMYVYSIQTCFYSTNLISANTNTLIFSPGFLWADTYYKIQVIAVNIYGNYSNSTFKGTTLSISSPITITLNFAKDVSGSLNTVVSALAVSLGVVPGRLTFTGLSSLKTVSWVLNVDRSSSTSPSDLYSGLDSSLLAYLLSVYGYNSISSSSIVSSTYSVPTGTLAFNSTSLNTITVAASFNSISGQVCCIAETTPVSNSTLNSLQVFLGINRVNTKVPSNCTAITGNFNLIINGVSPLTTYNVSCISASAYPTWPSISSIKSFAATTTTVQNLFTTSYASAVYNALILFTII